MNLYVYKDVDKGSYFKGGWSAPVVFQTEANTISDADSEYEKQFGKHPAKCVNIVCQVFQNKNSFRDTK